jgi:1-acyl-sn-glycerol-3-phosphate acyltransferase
MLRTIITVLFVVLFLVCSIPIFLFEWILSKFNKKAYDYSNLRIVQWALRVVAFLSGVKLTIIGEENVPTDEAVLYVGNHRSFFDIVLSYARCPRPTGYISKDSVEKVPLLNIWMRRLYCLGLNRSNTREALKVILKAIEQVKAGISMTIYPEGTRNRTPEEGLLPFKEGSMKIAEKTGCPIVPMAIVNSEQVLEAHFPYLRATHVVLEYGKPIYPAKMSRDEKRKLGSQVQEIISDMVEKNTELYFTKADTTSSNPIK